MKKYTVSDYKTVLQKLHAYHPAGLRAYEAWNYLHVYVFRYMLFPQDGTDLGRIKRPVHFLKQVVRIVGVLMLRRYTFSGTENAAQKTILYLSDYYGSRKDMRATMQLIGHITNKTETVCVRAERRFSPNPKYIFLALNWLRQLRALKLDDALVTLLLHDTATAYLYARAVRKDAERLLRANALLSLNDENADENILMQFCKQNGIPTATLQHGHFWNTKDSEEVIHYAHNFKELTADYFWAWGQYTCDLAEKDGVTRERLLPVGILKYADDPEKLPLRHERVFGVFLDGVATGAKTNLDLIRFANRLSESFGYSYYIKLHPTDSPDRYRGLVNDRCLGFAEPMSVLEFSRQIDFSIVCASTVVFEQLYFAKPCFRYLPPDSIDLFEGIAFSVFSDEQQLYELMRLYSEQTDAYMRQYLELTAYCCGAGSIAENYRNAIRQLDQKRNDR